MTTSPEQITRIAHKILDRVEAIFDQLEDRLAPLEARNNPLRLALLREASDIMGLWHGCEAHACRRAKQCRRRPSTCIPRLGPLVPPDIRAGVLPELRARLAAWRDSA
jgi:hypothetical protein